MVVVISFLPNTPYTYLWNTIPPQTTKTATGLAAGVYCCSITDANGCTSSICVAVTDSINCPNGEELYLPNAFSPNNDGENDALKIYYADMNCIKTFKLFLYDRWGEKILETTDPNFSWNGTCKGKTMNTQVLAYYMHVQFTNQTMIEKKRNISLVR